MEDLFQRPVDWIGGVDSATVLWIGRFGERFLGVSTKPGCFFWVLRCFAVDDFQTKIV